ncbi:MAG: DUF4781 domain-containing protein, partial [Desulfovibrionaceae bacterium]|nr:DUF4781 domain-containing protein [Desulfovibrionaceae bacterium]
MPVSAPSSTFGPVARPFYRDDPDTADQQDPLEQGGATGSGGGLTFANDLKNWPPPAGIAIQLLVKPQPQTAAAPSGNPALPADAKAAASKLQSLDAADAKQAIDQLEREGKLDQFTAGLVKSDGWFTQGGLGKDEQGRFLADMSVKLDGARLASLQRSFAKAGDEHGEDVARAVANHAPTQTKIEFVQSMAAGASEGRSHITGVLIEDRQYFNADAQAAATALSSLRGADAQQGFAAVPQDRRQTVFNAAAGLEQNDSLSEYDAPLTNFKIQADRFDALLAAARSIEKPADRGQVMGQMADAVQAMGKSIHPKELAPIANATLRALDNDILSDLPEQASGLAATAAQGGNEQDLIATVTALSSRPASPARDASLRVMFLKTGADAYVGQPNLAPVMGQALARTQTSDPAQAHALGIRYADMLGTPEGRALLSDTHVAPEARLWAAGQVAANPRGMQTLIARQDKPWETAGVAELSARGMVEQYAANRANAATALHGGIGNSSDIYNFVGASLGLRANLSDDPQTAHNRLNQAAQGHYNCYEGVQAVEQAGKGLEAARLAMGGGDIEVSVLPIQFSSQQTGPVHLQLYKAQANGQSRYVDNTGKVYKDFEDWKADNDLPAGKMTYPANGQIGAPGQTRLETADTPNGRDTLWNHTKNILDDAALIGGVVASGVILLGSGGLAAPVVVAAWGVAGASALWTGSRALAVLVDRNGHEQSLSLADPDARAAWLSLAGSALTVGGAGMGRLATLAEDGTRTATTLARAAGIVNTVATTTDTVAAANQAYGLASNWSEMSPAERAQASLQLAFWAGMKGLSARSASQGLDGYSFRQQMRHAEIDSGAAMRLNPNLPPDDASVVPSRNGAGAINGIEIEYGEKTSPEVIAIHVATARDMVSASGPDGALTRWATGRGFKPGSYGEQVSFEAIKHERLIAHYDEALQNPNLPAQERQLLQAQRASAVHDRDFYRSELSEIEANPALGRQAAVNDGAIDVKQTKAVVLDAGGNLPRSASAMASWDHLQTSIQARYPDARPINVERNGIQLPDGARMTNTGGDGQRNGVQLYRFVSPQSKGGYGGKVFYDAKSGHLILAVNARSAVNPKL